MAYYLLDERVDRRTCRPRKSSSSGRLLPIARRGRCSVFRRAKRNGYANRTLGLRLPLKNRVAGAELRARLQTIGILRESGHEHFNGSLVIPILDAEGHAVEVYGRKLRDDLRPGTPKHLYLPGPHRGLFNLAGVIEAGARTDDGPGARELIVCEALIDALTFWVHGYTNVTTAYGVEGFSDEMLATVVSSGIVRVFIAFDRDEAGERGAERLTPGANHERRANPDLSPKSCPFGSLLSVHAAWG